MRQTPIAPNTPFDQARRSAAGLFFSLTYKDCPVLELAMLECALHLMAGLEPPDETACRLPPELLLAVQHLAGAGCGQA